MTLNKKRWLEADRERNGPISLWDFSRLEDAQDAAWVHASAKQGGWRISDDSMTIGGYSRGTLELVHTPQDYQCLLRGERSLSMLDPTTIQELSSSSSSSTSHAAETETNVPFIPFVRWKGTIDTRINPNRECHLEEGAEKRVKRSGFCAIRSSEYPFDGANLGGRYNALEITCRSDGRPYSVNMKLNSFIEDDMFQCFIAIPPTIDESSKEGGQQQEKKDDNNHLVSSLGGRFDQVVLLFRHFIVTAGGRTRAIQRKLDNDIKVKSIGFTLMDGVDGDFQFDLARIRAVNYDETGVIGDAD